MNVIVTGASGGIGTAIARRFLSDGHAVAGIDTMPSVIEDARYAHAIADITKDELPDMTADILVNCAGVQNTGRDIEVNLKGAIRVTEKYAFTGKLKSVLFIASASARSGAEFAEYAASKGGLVSYMKNVALRLAPSGGTSNSLSPGGVYTRSNARVIDDPQKWQRIMSLTPLKKWATADEIAEWAYFVTVINSSMTAQDILIDNGEQANAEFVW